MAKFVLSDTAVADALEIYPGTEAFSVPKMSVIIFLLDNFPELRTKRLFRIALHYPKLLEKFEEYGFSPTKKDFRSILELEGKKPATWYYALWVSKLKLKPEEVAEAFLALSDEAANRYEDHEWVKIIKDICRDLHWGPIKNKDHPFVQALLEKWGDPEDTENYRMRGIFITKLGVPLPEVAASLLKQEFDNLEEEEEAFRSENNAFDRMELYAKILPNVNAILHRYQTIRNLLKEEKYRLQIDNDRGLVEIMLGDMQKALELEKVDLSNNYPAKFYLVTDDFEMALKIGEDCDMNYSEVVTQILQEWGHLKKVYSYLTVRKLDIFFNNLPDIEPVLEILDKLDPIIRKYLRDHRGIKMKLTNVDRELNSSAKLDTIEIRNLAYDRNIILQNVPQKFTIARAMKAIREKLDLPLTELEISGHKTKYSRTVSSSIISRRIGGKIVHPVQKKEQEEILEHENLTYDGISDEEAEKIKWPLVISCQ
jgi:hypothetical protein